MTSDHPDISFGPEGQQWHYSKVTKTYDISAGSIKKMTIPTTEGPKETFVTIDPESSVLVVVDMQNFFLDPQCMQHPNGLKAVEPTIRVIEKCREAGIQVMMLNSFAKKTLISWSRDWIYPSTDNLAQLGPYRPRHEDPTGRCAARLSQRYFTVYHHVDTILYGLGFRPWRQKRTMSLCWVLECGYLPSTQGARQAGWLTLCEEPHEWALEPGATIA